ncbi:flagellar protein FlgN [Agromyces seonyuensis]|uniref:Flagellar protein FlgN n=1 Tax=Agromyces seonyuensis TaxID=2662446 RepID=A0A6I4P455_9MICO|nr:flagellar protein FlgN [Agromyces seonyuensis]MWB98197.1 flagellar protein FlgN [Agromyces seonyuensis]
MSGGVEIPYDVLNRLNGSLKQIIVEFDRAGARGDALEAAIGRPFGRGGLRDAAGKFESAWNDKRDTLREKLEEIQQKVDQVGSGWADWDADASAQLRVESGDTTRLPKAV